MLANLRPDGLTILKESWENVGNTWRRPVRAENYCRRPSLAVGVRRLKGTNKQPHNDTIALGVLPFNGIKVKLTQVCEVPEQPTAKYYFGFLSIYPFFLFAR